MDGVLTPPPDVVGVLPEAAPLDMPVQSLRPTKPLPLSGRGRREAAGEGIAEAHYKPRTPSTAPRLINTRRILVIGGAVIMTIDATYEMYRVLGVNGPTPLAIGMLVLFVPLFAWIALSFTSALAGFFSLLSGGGRRLLDDEPTTPTARTALLMPTYNEAPARVMAGLQATWESLMATGAPADMFDVFILSDTTDPDTWIEEEAAFLALRARTDGYGRIYYRRRLRNTARKAGNIADWVSRFGGAYPQFLILDADSVMTGDALVRLVNAMERHPGVGLIQTLPIITGGSTLFARIQQFAGRIYGPLIAHGIAWWHGSEGNYWGHNAIIRTRAFAEAAGLPELRGRKPFGGPILSHDFIEAAFLRRAGWAVHMVPGLPGSYEACPPSLTDLAIRDRRWCQGNLQHVKVLPAHGLHPISRLHLLTGIGSYITAPLWLLFILTGILIALQARFVPPNYFPAGRSLFPVWPVIDPVRAMWMFVGTMALLLLPKVLGFIVVAIHGPSRRGSGGVARLLLGLLVESIIAGLIAPVVMITQSQHFVSILSGRDSGWNAQQREDGSIPFRVTARQYRWHTLLGLALGGMAWAISTSLALWMLPVVLGLALAIPLAAATARRSFGVALRRVGLLRIPEESHPPDVLARATILAAELDTEAPDVPRGVSRLLHDPLLLAAHRRMLPPRRPARPHAVDTALAIARARLDAADSLDTALAAMPAAELLACLTDIDTLDRMTANLDHAVGEVGWAAERTDRQRRG